MVKSWQPHINLKELPAGTKIKFWIGLRFSGNPCGTIKSIEHFKNKDGATLVWYWLEDGRRIPMESICHVYETLELLSLEVKPRRLLDDEMPSGYMESDRDFMENNREACVWFLEKGAEYIKSLEDERDSLMARAIVAEEKLKSK